jgi:hypothetical protein
MRATGLGIRVGLLSAAAVVGLVPLVGGMADAATPRLLASSGSAEHVVRTEALPTVISVRSSDRTSQFRQRVTFIASVASKGKAMPTGDVQFAVDDVALGGPVGLSNGEATSESVADLAVGTHKVTATYSGSTRLLLASNEGSLAGGQLVTDTYTITTLKASDDPYVKRGAYPLTFTVRVSSHGSDVPGNVNLSIGTDDYLGVLRYGSATFTLPRSVADELPLGDNVINAEYLSDSPEFRNSSDEITLLVK